MSTNAEQTGELLERPQPTSAIVEYTQTEAALADLRGRLKSIVFDVTTTAGDKVARAARKECVTLRTALEDKRLELNAKDHERIKGRNLEAKRITTEIEALEGPIDSQIKAEETRKENERKAKAEAERQRIERIQSRIDEIRQYPLNIVGTSSANIEGILKTVVELEIGESFQELKQQAEGAKATTLIRLRAALANAQAMEVEQARLATERAENERIRAENEKAAAVERQRLADENAVLQARIDAQKAEEVRVEAARMADFQRIADAQAQLERDQEELRVAQALAAAPAPVDEPAAESGSVAPAIEEPADPLLMSIRLTEYLPMETVCKFAKEWAVFQGRDSKLEQKKDRKLAQQAREAEANLLAVVEQLA